MVVLNVKNIKGLALILLLVAGILASCSKDRLIDIKPYVYPTENWKKDSLVYTLFNEEEQLFQESTPYSISSVDTLFLFYEGQKFSLNFLDNNKGDLVIGVDSGSFIFEYDSLFLFGFLDTISRKVVLKEDSSLVLEYSIINNSYLRQYREYYSLVSVNTKELQVSFLNDIYNPIFYNNGEGRCMPCHNSDGGQIRLAPANVAYENLINGVSKNDGGVDYINSLQPEESYLYRLVADENVEYLMPPNNALTPFEVQTILTWISQGAQDN